MAGMPAPRRGAGRRSTGLTHACGGHHRGEAVRTCSSAVVLRGAVAPAQPPAGARRTSLNPRCWAPMPDSGTFNKTLTPGRRFSCVIMCPLGRHPKPASGGSGEDPGSLGTRLCAHPPDTRVAHACACRGEGVWVSDPSFLLRGQKLKPKELNENYLLLCFSGLRKRHSIDLPCKNLVSVSNYHLTMRKPSLRGVKYP